MKLPGVESAEVSLDKASADIRLKPDNRITLPQLREVLKKNGYPTRDAQVEARGMIVDRGGTPVFDLLNGATMELDEKGAATKATPEAVDVTGVSRAESKAAERLTIRSVRR
jgi:copper chaperone CopZ